MINQRYWADFLFKCMKNIILLDLLQENNKLKKTTLDLTNLG